RQTVAAAGPIASAASISTKEEMGLRRIHMSKICGWLVVCVAVIALTSVISAQTKIIHLSYSGHGDAWHQYLRTMSQRFEAETGIKVEVIVSASGQVGYGGQLLTMIIAGAAPDVTDANPALAGVFLGQGSFVDLRPLLERDGF